MPKYNFIAVDSKGKEVTGTVEAGGESEVEELIRSKGYFPSEVTQAGGKKKRGKKKEKQPRVRTTAKKTGKKGLDKEINIVPASWSRVRPKELMVFTRQLSTLVDAGLPLIRGLEVLERQNKNPKLKASIIDMIDSINAGSTFADAMASHATIFDRLYVNMVKAGEMGGVLDKVLESLAEFMEKMQKIKNKVVSAMVYPVVVGVMALLILAFLMVFIIPKFKEIFDDVLGGAQLPMLTRMVMAVSDMFTHHILLILVGVGVAVAGFFALKATDGGRSFLDLLKLKMPLFGQLVLKTGVSRFCRTLGTLMDSGVPVLQALVIVRETAGNAVLAKAVNTVHDAVKEGENIAPPMESTRVFPPMVISMIEVGEETGELPQMLGRIADNYEDEVDNTVAGITSVIEPIMIIFLALIVGVIVIALFLPLIQIITDLQ
jgi:type IV pilus assembly protein PilC